MCAMAAEQRRVPAVPVPIGYGNASHPKGDATVATPPMCVPQGLEQPYEAIRQRHNLPLDGGWFSPRAFVRRDA